MNKLVKRTTHSERVLKYLKHHSKPLTAYDILDALQADGVTASTTVYRALTKLLALGLVHRIESLNAWVACSESHKGKLPLFTICDKCRSVTEYADTPFSDNIVEFSERTGFSLSHSIIEVHGRCSNCNSDKLI